MCYTLASSNRTQYLLCPVAKVHAMAIAETAQKILFVETRRRGSFMNANNVPNIASFIEHERINLRRQYPISPQLIIKRALPWLFCFSLSVTLFILLDVYFPLHPPGQSVSSFASLFHETLLWLSLFLGITAAVKLLREMLYRYCYYYGIEAGHLVISKGILIKQRGAFPLSRITDVYLDRTFGDFLLGLYNLHVSTPTLHSAEFARVDGLRGRTAVSLQEYLTACLEASQQHAEGLMTRHEMAQVLHNAAKPGAGARPVEVEMFSSM